MNRTAPVDHPIHPALAERAPVLAISVMHTEFSRNGAPNPGALYDLGLATAQLTVEAVSRGVSVHQMGGTLPETLRARDSAPRTRKPLAEFVCGGQWGRAAELADRDRDDYIGEKPWSAQ